MVLKIFRAIWFLSALAVLANLLYVYAGFPELVVVREESLGSTSLDRDTFFYLALLTLAIVNVLVYLVSKAAPRDEELRSWFHGLVITLNFFFIIAFSLIGVVNSAERYNYSGIGFAIYGSVILFLLWAISWPVYKIFKRVTSKPTV
jgi:hypothetical protein